jgi:hypothetical protein
MVCDIITGTNLRDAYIIAAFCALFMLLASINQLSKQHKDKINILFLKKSASTSKTPPKFNILTE